MFSISLLFLLLAISNIVCQEDNITTTTEINLNSVLERDPEKFKVKCPLESERFFACNYGTKYFCVCNMDKEMGDTVSCKSVESK